MTHKRNLTWDEWVKLKRLPRYEICLSGNGRDSERQAGQRREVDDKEHERATRGNPYTTRMGQGSLIPWPMNEARNG